MAIIGSLIKKGIRLGESIEQQYTSPSDLQRQQLRKLLISARSTLFGKHYGFEDILKSGRSADLNSFYREYCSRVPIHDYNKIHQDWWSRSLNGIKEVTWPGKVKYFALSSGTSGAPSKRIPVTKDMIKSMRKTSVRQILTLSKYELPDKLLTKGILMLGGSTDLKRNGDFFEGDLSGITTSQVPFWFQRYYKPGKKISRSNWETKLDEIMLKAKDWDIGIIVGVPAWLQLLIEKIVDHYKVENIHDIWPNLEIFVHGGVPFQPYKKGFERLLKSPLIYIETYLASEGFIAFQSRPNQNSMSLVLNHGIFYEFIPYNEENFDEDGELKANPITLTIDQVEKGKPYALLISTNAGAWRYMIGDVVNFTSVEDAEIIIAGRTKLFLSLCGEHLSIDNMSRAIELTEEKLNVAVKEFTVLGKVNHPHFEHNWYIGTEEEFDEQLFSTTLDDFLCQVNDDYAVERQHALKYLQVKRLSPDVFLEFMKHQGKVGAQIKFPRVLKNQQASGWEAFIKQY